jgi:N-methylhydantoinase A
MHRILNAMMADAIKVASVNRGFDPRRFSLLGLGGAGPVHAGALARMLGCEQAVVPQLPGVLCANGLLAADIEHEHSRTFFCDADKAVPAELETAFAGLLAICAERMERDGIDSGRSTVSRSIDARYVGQSYDLQIEVPEGAIGPGTIAQLVDAFHEAHERVYGHAQRSQKVRFVTLRGMRAYRVANPRFSASAVSGTAEAALKGKRDVLFDLDAGFQPTPIYDRQLLPVGATVAGPAILEQPDTTTLVHPGQAASIDHRSNVVIHPIGSAS